MRAKGERERKKEGEEKSDDGPSELWLPSLWMNIGVLTCVSTLRDYNSGQHFPPAVHTSEQTVTHRHITQHLMDTSPHHPYIIRTYVHALNDGFHNGCHRLFHFSEEETIPELGRQWLFGKVWRRNGLKGMPEKNGINNPREGI